MKPIRVTEEQIIGILREQEAGVKTADVCRKHGISSATFYKWTAASKCRTPSGWGLPYRVSLVRYGLRDVAVPRCLLNVAVFPLGDSPCLHRRIIGVRFTAQFLSNRTCNFQVNLIPDATWPGERREDAAARRFDGAQVKGSRPI